MSLIAIFSLGCWLEHNFWSCEEDCGHYIVPSEWRASIYFTLPEQTSNCSPLCYIYIYFRGIRLVSTGIFVSLYFQFSFLCDSFMSYILCFLDTDDKITMQVSFAWVTTSETLFYLISSLLNFLIFFRLRLCATLGLISI